ncbi:MAG: hypothetical protein GC201_04795 [Alphaproteobacteria bacterium]|nr:hypothetical protein [Alphaproteobacteria bacterium]
MNIEEFERLVNAWGGDSARWPEQERTQAAALLERSAEARALRETAAALDAVLASAAAPEANARLRESIMAVPGRTRQQRRAGRWFRLGASGVLPRFVGLAAAMLLGFYVGTTSLLAPAPSFAADTDTVNVSDYVFGDTAQDYGVTVQQNEVGL